MYRDTDAAERNDTRKKENGTQIVSHRHEQAILIENPDVADALRQIFEIVWKSIEE